MTTSRETEDLHHDTLRQLVDQADALPIADRMTLLKGLIPGVVREMAPQDFAAFAAELRLKGERFYDAQQHPGEGKADRTVIGERSLEGR
jgi:hypothetical protein